MMKVLKSSAILFVILFASILCGCDSDEPNDFMSVKLTNLSGHNLYQGVVYYRNPTGVVPPIGEADFGTLEIGEMKKVRVRGENIFVQAKNSRGEVLKTGNLKIGNGNQVTLLAKDISLTD